MLAPIALTVLVSLLLGLPIALYTRKPQDSWLPYVADGFVFGFVIFALAPTVYAWTGFPGLIVFAVLWLAAVGYAIATRLPWPSQPGRPDRRGIVIAAIAVVIAVVAVLFRLHNDNFLPWLGDMGAYVNWGNQFARTGVLSASWPPLLPSYLGLASWAFGAGSVTATMGVAGLVLIVAVARFLGMVGVNRWIILVVDGLATVNLHAIWYSYFPSSEALDAPMFVAWIVTIVGVIRSSRPAPWLVLSGATMLALGLTRGSGPFLLIPLAILAVLVLIVKQWRSFARRVWLLFAAGLAGSAGAYWYGISRIPNYYVTTQFRDLVPVRVANFFQFTLHVFDATWPTAVVIVVIIAAFFFIAARITPADETAGTAAERSRLPQILTWVLVALLVLGIGAAAIVHAGGWLILTRIGLEYTIAMIVALLLANSRRVDPLVGALVLFIGAIAALFIALQTYRLTNHNAHAFFIYWDRYFVSEVLPCLFLLTGIAAQLVFVLARDRGWVRPRLRTLPAVAIASVVVIGAVAATQASQLGLISSNSYLQGAYSMQAALDKNIPNLKTPVLWTATSTRQYPGFFFPNTWMAFARPMEVSFGYAVQGIDDRNNFGPDETPTKTMIEQALACTGASRVIVFEVRDGGERLLARVSDPALGITSLSTVKGTISLLSEPPRNGKWQRLGFTTDVYSVRLTPGSTLPACSSAQ